MKTIVLIISIVLLVSFQSFSQLEFEGTIKSNFKAIQFEDGEMKFYNFDPKSQNIKFYNLDNSLWKTIQLPLDKNHYFEELLLVSQNTINTDDEIELVYTSIEYNYTHVEEDPNDDNDLVRYTLNIVNESGQKLLTVPNSQRLKLSSSNGINKLLVYKGAEFAFRDDSEILVYALPIKK